MHDDDEREALSMAWVLFGAAALARHKHASAASAEADRMLDEFKRRYPQGHAREESPT